MHKFHSGIDPFFAVLGQVKQQELETIEQLRQTKGYQCPTALDLTIHLILELYDQGSSAEANVARICSNLEMEADQLLHLSKRVRALG